MDLGLRGKSVLILASSKGLGKASALEFAREGARVMITSRNEEELKRTAAEIELKTGSDVSYCSADLTSYEDIRNLVINVKEQFGTIDVLVNNTGGPPSGDFDDFTDNEWYRAFELNLLSYIRVIREVLPMMRAQKSGRIINIASSSIKQPVDNLILSNTFRTGILGLAKTLANELAKDNILINTIGPGLIETDRLRGFDIAKANELGICENEVKNSKISSVPIGRYGKPDEFAKTLLYLGSFANTYVTGQAILIDGGLVKAI